MKPAQSMHCTQVDRSLVTSFLATTMTYLVILLQYTQDFGLHVLWALWILSLHVDVNRVSPKQNLRAMFEYQIFGPLWAFHVISDSLGKFRPFLATLCHLHLRIWSASIALKILLETTVDAPSMYIVRIFAFVCTENKLFTNIF